MTAEPLKRCSKCRVEKPLGEFHREARASDGRRPACKECVRESARRWHSENRDKSRENGRVQSRRRATNGRKAEDNRRRRTRLASRTPEQIAADRFRLRPTGLKKCRGGHWLPFEAFPVSRAEADGLNAKCRTCDHAGLLHSVLDRWEDADHWRDIYTSHDFEEVEHTLPVSSFGPGDGNPNDPLNLAPASVQTNRGSGGKHTKAPLDYVEELHGSGVIDWLLAGGVEIRELSAA